MTRFRRWLKRRALNDKIDYLSSLIPQAEQRQHHEVAANLRRQVAEAITERDALDHTLADLSKIHRRLLRNQAALVRTDIKALAESDPSNARLITALTRLADACDAAATALEVHR